MAGNIYVDVPDQYEILKSGKEHYKAFLGVLIKEETIKLMKIQLTFKS